MKVGNHNYFLSWREPWHKFEVRWRQADLGLHTTHQAASPTSRILIFLYTASYFQDWDWFNGRNFCRDRCMDLVSFNTPGEFEMFSEIMKRGNILHSTFPLVKSAWSYFSRGIFIYP